MPRKQAGYGQPAVYNSTLPDYTDGDYSALQVDAKGRLIVSNLAADGAVSPGGGMTTSGEYNATPPTVTDGQALTLQIDSNGNLRVSQASRLDPVNDAITTYAYGHSYTNIVTNTTTTVKTGAGVIKAITLNNPSLITVANLTVTVYDNTAGSGTKIGTLTFPFGSTTAMPLRVTYESAFTTGLTLVTAGPTVPGDITVEYR
jgi:hypothetical protein